MPGAAGPAPGAPLTSPPRARPPPPAGGQAYGAKKYALVGVILQRALIIVMLMCLGSVRAAAVAPLLPGCRPAPAALGVGGGPPGRCRPCAPARIQACRTCSCLRLLECRSSHSPASWPGRAVLCWLAQVGIWAHAQELLLLIGQDPEIARAAGGPPAAAPGCRLGQLPSCPGGGMAQRGLWLLGTRWVQQEANAVRWGPGG
jgi:hypothetical protein